MLVSSTTRPKGRKHKRNVGDDGRRTTRRTRVAITFVGVLVAGIAMLGSSQKQIRAIQGLASTGLAEFMADWVTESQNFTFQQQPPASSQRTDVNTTSSNDTITVMGNDFMADWVTESQNLTIQQQPPPSSQKTDVNTTSSNDTITVMGNEIVGNETQQEKKEKPVQTDGMNRVIPEDPNRPPVLCGECWEVVKKAPWVNLTYEDVSGGHVDHPHMGARYGPNASNTTEFGFVYNVTTLHRNPIPLGISSKKKKFLCAKRDHDRVALSRLALAREYLPKDENNDRTPAKEGVKILCAIYSAKKFHGRIVNLQKTWASRCDGFFAASDTTDELYNAVNVVHRGNEAYSNIWQKVRSIWSYIYDNYYNDFDWFHLGGDDMWVTVENLRLYLNSVEIQTAERGGENTTTDTAPQFQKPLLLGCRFYTRRVGYYVTGGPGYTINKAALKLLVTKGLPSMYLKDYVPWEDVQVSRILRKFGAQIYPTQDELGGERYHHLTAGRHFANKIPKQIRDATSQLKKKKGKDHSSRQSISFHMVKGDEMIRYHLLIYGLCK